MLTCLHDYVGLAPSEDTGPYDVPESGLYIITLPGMSLEAIDKIADPDQIYYLGVWNDTQTEAAIRFLIDFIYELQKCYKISKDCDYEAMICANKLILVNPWRYLLGNQLMLFRLHTNRLNRYTTIDLKDAEILRIYYEEEYRRALTQAVQLIDVSSCELCCGTNPEWVTMLP